MAGKKSGGRRSANRPVESIDAIVEAIEGKLGSKSGMTKQQVAALEEKRTTKVLGGGGGGAGNDRGRGLRVTEAQIRQALLMEKQRKEEAMKESVYVNEWISLPEKLTRWHEAAPNKYIRYEQFDGSEESMDYIVDLFSKELSEPYSSFTYQYFVYGWPDLTITVYGKEGATCPAADEAGQRVGAVVSRVRRKGPGQPLRGYIAMFAVTPSFRGFRLGSRLVSLTIDLMREKKCDDVYLETPLFNERALSLYLNLGFVKTKFLPRYYLDHSDAARLKLWLTPPPVAASAAAVPEMMEA